MSAFAESYNKVKAVLEAINTQIVSRRAKINEIESANYEDIPQRIQRLEEQLEKIDEYLLKVKSFQEIAKQNLKSTNLLTIEARPGYRVNLNRLRNWAMMIDPMSADDPYAQRVYMVAKCDEHFLKQKQKEFNARIKELKSSNTGTRNEETERLEREINEFLAEMKEYAQSEPVVQLAETVKAENDKFWYTVAPEAYAAPEENAEEFAFGAYRYPLPFDESVADILEDTFGKYYSRETASIISPLTIPVGKEYVLTTKCAPVRTQELDRAVQNLILNQIEKHPAGNHKVYVIDGSRFNTSSLGSLRKLEGTYAVAELPRNQEEITSALETIVASFGDIDDIIDRFDSVEEYNASVDEAKRIATTTLIIYGWPIAYSGKDKELIERIMKNYERYGVSIIAIEFLTGKENHTSNNSLPQYAMINAMELKLSQNDTSITLPQQAAAKFSLYTFDDELSDDYVSSLLAYNKTSTGLGNDYTKRHDMSIAPTYSMEKKPIILPFGVDNKDAESFISFDNHNFAAYLIGQAGSGKSTLIHTIIAGILRDYHPDNVELWLADFKQVEFQQYIDHTPPHVKYILLDEAHELVYDLIDKLTEEMLRRQQILSKLGKENILDVDPVKELVGHPLPVIFVIIDEFTIMSQALDDNQNYKLLLQNLLVKGRALGFKFLFASQKFTSGMSGLTATAKDQIQQRIAMKQSKEEINAVLELSSNLRTERVSNWIESIPPHYVLIKQRIDDETLEVNRYKSLYFGDNYESRNAMIDAINAKMKPVAIMDLDDPDTYVDKKPVFVDGNSYDAYDAEAIDAMYKKGKHEADEMVLTLGTPRLMSKFKPVVLSTEARENMLLVARSSETTCTASVILSAIKQALAQGKKVSIWAYDRNKLYREYSSVLKLDGVKHAVGIDEICGEIRSLKDKIDNKVSSQELIVGIGLDRICIDFGYEGMTSNAAKKVQPAITQAVQEEKDPVAIYNEMRAAVAKRLAPVKADIRAKGRESGMSEADIKQAISEARTRIAEEVQKEFKISDEELAAMAVKVQEAAAQNAEQQSATEVKVKNPVVSAGSYNAKDDFVAVIKQGSRLGIHFMLVINNLVDLKPIEVRSDEFRHKLAFQISSDDSISLFARKVASTLPEHICYYDNSNEKYSFRPYIHAGIEWDGWRVDETGKLKSPKVND